MSWAELILRVFISYGVLLLMTRFMGKKQLSQLTFFNYVTGITIGSMASTHITDSDFPILQGAFSIILWSVLTILMEYISLKSQKSRKIIDGKPTVLINHGQLVVSAMKKVKINLDELNMMLRKSNVFNTKEVDYAILETSGDLTVLKKSEYQNASKKDTFTPLSQTKNLTTQIISEGIINKNNLSKLKVDEKWLKFEAARQGHKNIDEIFYAEVDGDGQLFIMPIEKENTSKIN